MQTTTLQIQAELDSANIKALTNFLHSLDPKATITQSQAPYKLGSKDEKRLKETLRLYKEGKLEFHSFDEAVAQSNEKLKELGAKL